MFLAQSNPSSPGSVHFPWIGFDRKLSYPFRHLLARVILCNKRLDLIPRILSKLFLLLQTEFCLLVILYLGVIIVTYRCPLLHLVWIAIPFFDLLCSDDRDITMLWWHRHLGFALPMIFMLGNCSLTGYRSSLYLGTGLSSGIRFSLDVIFCTLIWWWLFGISCFPHRPFRL